MTKHMNSTTKIEFKGGTPEVSLAEVSAGQIKITAYTVNRTQALALGVVIRHVVNAMDTLDTEVTPACIDRLLASPIPCSTTEPVLNLGGNPLNNGGAHVS
jgi:hypothetical protein